MNKSNRSPRFELMYQAVLSLKDIDECHNFFSDLCTVAELQAMEQRFHVAWLLSKGYIYNDIVARTGASSATISRVKRSLQYGADGYQPVFDRLEAEETEEAENQDTGE